MLLGINVLGIMLLSHSYVCLVQKKSLKKVEEYEVLLLWLTNKLTSVSSQLNMSLRENEKSQICSSLVSQQQKFLGHQIYQKSAFWAYSSRPCCSNVTPLSWKECWRPQGWLPCPGPDRHWLLGSEVCLCQSHSSWLDHWRDEVRWHHTLSFTKQGGNLF